ncbi:DNA-repair protein XRCC1-like [Cryptomeria japonica]|uniref:DNA-repair protein XRCC1-like n=1 Tax=Cryptomeria japonica TaxID=3369 RepID=UPI0027DA84BD|nr:DNA-repair protein XRCC1-like [Cryptomeria japonica]
MAELVFVVGMQIWYFSLFVRILVGVRLSAISEVEDPPYLVSAVSPKSTELKETAIEGIKACLEDAAKCLEVNKPVHTVVDDWEFIPRVVKELAALEDPRKASQTISREELCKMANNYKAIYDTELENMRRVIQQNKGPSGERDKQKAVEKNSRLTDTSKSDTDSDDTIVMGEDELDEAEAVISKKYQ